MPYISDDTLISLRYADRLVHGLGLTWTDGPRVEGYSNLLWVLACALMGELGFDLITGARILGLFGMSAALTAIVYAYRPKDQTLSSILSLLAGVLVFGLSGTIAVWTVGGLEQPFVAAFLAWMIAFLLPVIAGENVHARSLLLPGLFAGLLCLTRPDSPLFMATACITILIACGVTRRSFILIGAFLVIPILCMAGQELFRLLYYGDWLPNTARAKVSPSFIHFLHGGFYVVMEAIYGLPVLAVFCVAAILGYRRAMDRKLLLLFFIPCIVWLSYIWMVGGDIFPARRHFTPIVVFASLLVPVVVKYYCTVRGTVFTMRCIGIGVLVFGILQFKDYKNRDAVEGELSGEWRSIAIATYNAFFQQRPLIGVDAAGAVPYWTGFPSVDMLGLNDSYIAHHRRDDIGKWFIGHGLGDGEYVLSRKPDLIFVNGTFGGFDPSFASCVSLMQDPAFFHLYIPVKFQVHGSKSLRVLLWANKYSEKIGIYRRKDTVIIPGWLANEDSVMMHNYPVGNDDCSLAAWYGDYNGNGKAFAAAAEWNKDDGLVTVTTSKTPARMNNIALTRGAWYVLIEPQDTSLCCKIYSSSVQNKLADGFSSAFALSDSTSVNIVITPRDTAVHQLKTIRFVRDATKEE